MHHTQKHIARLVVLRLDVILYRFGEWRVANLVALDNLATLPLNNNDVVVFVNHPPPKNYRANYMFMPPSIWMTWPLT